jgi:hypothetical protein
MGAPYTSVSISNYNANPPADDGSEVPANRVDWSKHKEKLGDPLKTAVESINTNITAAMGKVWGGGGVTNTAISYGISASDQGKLVRATASGITLTTPAAATVTSPFVCAILNNSSGTITVDGNGSETIDGNANITLGAGQGCFLVTDGTNWFTTGLGAIPAGNQMGYGQIINGTLAESNTGNAVTYSLKTLAGNNPSASDPVVIAFRSATAGSGLYVYRSVTAALSITVPSGATLGVTNSIPFRIWIVIFDDAGTLRLGVINCLSGTNIYPLGQTPRPASSTAVGTGSDSAHLFYTDSAVSFKPYVVLGYATYEGANVLATAGSWNVAPVWLQLFGLGVPLPGTVIQEARTVTTAADSTAANIALDNSKPQLSEGKTVISRAITPTSAVNLLEVGATVVVSNDAGSACIAALFQDAVADALAASATLNGSANPGVMTIEYAALPGVAAGAATTFKLNIGGTSNTTRLNANSSNSFFDGVSNSFVRAREIMA